MEGKLRKNDNKRFEIRCDQDGRRYELTSGDLVEIKVAGHWIRTRVEHNGKDYYATVAGAQLQEGLDARVPE